MQANYRVTLAVLAGVVIGVMAVKGLNAQAPSASKLPAFYIAELEVSDPEGLKPYGARVLGTVEQFGGRFIVRAGKIAPLEGEAPKGRIAVIAFESMEKAQAWYDSPAYQEIKPIRQKAAKSRTFIVEGTANQPAQRGPIRVGSRYVLSDNRGQTCIHHPAAAAVKLSAYRPPRR